MPADVERFAGEPNAPPALSREPLRHALERVGPRGGIGAAMRLARGIGGVDQAGAQPQRSIGAVEFVVGAGIDDDLGAGAAASRLGDHLLAGRGRRPVVGATDEDEGEDARAPGGFAQAAAARIERDRRAEVSAAVARRRIRPHRPERGNAAARPAEQRNVLGAHEVLHLQPAPRGIGIGDALARRPHPGFAHAALRAEPARAIGIGKQHDKAVGHQKFRPFAVKLRRGGGTVVETAAIVQRHHRRERPRALRTVKRSLQRYVAGGDIHLFRRGGGGRPYGRAGKRAEKALKSHVGNVKQRPGRHPTMEWNVSAASARSKVGGFHRGRGAIMLPPESCGPQGTAPARNFVCA